MNALITIDFVVPVGHERGDYAKLHGNNGEGALDWGSPLSNEVFNLFPRGAGIYGWGGAPWGEFRWGHAHSMRTPGWGQLPWGRAPWGYGTSVIQARHSVNSCGDYKFGFACYDALGNLHEGSPEEAGVEIHIAPSAPAGLRKNSYNKETDVLLLDAA